MANDIIKTIVSLADMSVQRPKIDKAAKSYVKFGGTNQFPNELLTLAKESPLQSAILNNQFIYSMGAGFEEWTGEIFTPNLSYNWEELTRRCMRDYIYLQAFAVQIVLNENGKTYSFYHQPIDQVRLGNYNEFNIIDTAYICTSWKSATSKNIVEIPMWGSESIQKGKSYLMYFKDYDLDELYYPIPKWYSSANWILADILLSKYYVNTVGNGFTPSTVITYPNEMDNDKKAELYDMFKSCFSGVENASDIIILFGENGEKPEITPLNASNNADLYQDFSNEVLSKIISGNRLPSPTLAGISSPSNLGGASNELLTAYSQYKLTVIHDLRKFVLTHINGLLKLNGLLPVLNIIDFDLRAEIEGQIEKNEDISKETLDVESGDELDKAQEDAEDEAVENMTNNDEDKVG